MVKGIPIALFLLHGENKLFLLLTFPPLYNILKMKTNLLRNTLFIS